MPDHAGARLALGSALGALAAASGVALTATAGWLIARAAEHPPVLMLMVAIVGVRTFGLARPALRYAERLVSHDVALRLLAERRARVYDALVPLIPGRLGRQRGDVLASIVDDVDSLLDRYLRVRAPLVTYSAVATIATLFAAWVLPAAGVVTGLTLIVGGGLAYSVSRIGVARAEEQFVAGRAAVSAAVMHTLHGAADLIMAGGAACAVRRRRSRRGCVAGRFQVSSCCRDGACAGSRHSRARRPRHRLGGWAGVGRRPAVLAHARAAHPASPRSPGGDQPPRRRRPLQVRVTAADHRLAELAATAPAVTDPVDPLPAPPTDSTPPIELERVTAGWGAAPAFHHLDLDLPPGTRVAVVGPSGSGKSTLSGADAVPRPCSRGGAHREQTHDLADAR